MKHCYVQLGKIGDILSLLPILKFQFDVTHYQPIILVAKEFRKVLDRLDYVIPEVWDGSWQDLKGAVAYAKRKYNWVTVPQIFGADFPIQKLTPSFQLDQWLRAGQLQSWDILPLVLERPHHAKELKKRYLQGRPTILFSDHSQSSPFIQKDALAALLQHHFGTTHQILRLSEIRLTSAMDLLALFDAADCLVTVETMTLHLSAASKIPTVALIADSPTTWKGSGWSKRFLAHIRYVDYEHRRNEVVSAVRAGIEKRKLPQLSLFPTKHPFGYNPSIIEHLGKTLTSYRTHPDLRSWRTELHLSDGVETHPVRISGYEAFSLEDMRLFHFRDELYASATVARNGFAGDISPCAVGYGKLVFHGEQWELEQFHFPNYGKNQFNGQEKNWSFFEHQGRLMATYAASPKHVVLEIKDSTIKNVWESDRLDIAYGDLRGGTVPIDGIRFGHVYKRNPKARHYWTYHLAAFEMETDPPFRILRVSQSPILSGTEQYWHGWPFWKPRVLIPYGAIKRDGQFMVSVGVNDCACATVNLTTEMLNL